MCACFNTRVCAYVAQAGREAGDQARRGSEDLTCVWALIIRALGAPEMIQHVWFLSGPQSTAELPRVLEVAPTHI